MEEVDYNQRILADSSDYNTSDTQEGDESISDESNTSQSTSVPPETFLDPDDVGPSSVFYKSEQVRPEIYELRAKSRHLKISKGPPVDKQQKNMKTFKGVFLPVIVNLISMTYFTRAGKLVGDLGVVYSLAIIWISYVICIISITSLNAFGTNGEISGAGIYYVISRTIGPELGRSLTFFLDLSACLGTAATVVGFAESLVSMYDPKYFTGLYVNDIRLLSFAILIIATVLNNYWSWGLTITGITHAVGIICFFIGCFERVPGSTLGFLGPSEENFRINCWGKVTVS